MVSGQVLSTSALLSLPPEVRGPVVTSHLCGTPVLLREPPLVKGLVLLVTTEVHVHCCDSPLR